MNGHLFKFKNPNGEWVTLPYILVDMYNMYVEYCNEHNIECVSQDVYYETIGNLGSLVTQLAGSTDTVATFAAALENGVLPTSLGGTGLGLDVTLKDYLMSSTDSGGLNLATNEYVGNVATEVHDLTTGLDAMIGVGTEAPDAHGDMDSRTKYFFQIIDD